MEGARSGMQSISLAKLLLFQNTLPSKTGIREDVIPLVDGLEKLEDGLPAEAGEEVMEGG